MTKRKPCIVGNYRFTGKILGKGNFARVEEACHELLGVKVAVKIMDLNSIKEDYVVRNLFREAKIMSNLQHPCIVTLYETMQKSDNVYYLITEIVTGGDLCTYVKAQRNGKLDERSTKFFAQQFVSALSYMHQRGIVHRDLKMENVMLNAIQNQIKIVDFGLSNEWSADSPLKTHCGSPEYAAPELFVTSKVYGPEVDLWSLGIILYGMVVGQLPFVSNKTPNLSSQERRKLLVAQINRGISIPQRKAISSCSFEYRNLMNRLLNADSVKRLTIKEMLLHPWVTENGKKFVRTNPIRKISPLTHNKVISDISSVFGLGSAEVNKHIKEDAFGKAGGMYNIMVHKTVMKNFTPDQVTHCLSEAIDLNDKKKLKCKIEMPQRLIQTAREEDDKKSHPAARPQTMSVGGNDLNKTKTLLSSKVPQSFTYNPNVSRGSTPLTACGSKSSRPRSVQFSKRKSEPKESKRPVTSALQKRQEYSAIIASRFSKQNTPKTAKTKRLSDQDETTKRQIEYLKRIVSPHGQEYGSKEETKGCDSNLSGKSPRSSPTRRPRTNRSNSPRLSNTTTKSRRGSSSDNSPPYYAFMKLLSPHGDFLQKRMADGGAYMKESPKTGSQKSTDARYAMMPVDPRKSPIRFKLKTKRPISCHSNIENSLPISRRTSVVPVSETRTAKSTIATDIKPGRPFLEAYRGLCLLTNRRKARKNIYNIPTNNLEFIPESQPASARGDCERSTSRPRRIRSPPGSKLANSPTYISKNILTYLQNKRSHTQS